MEQSAVGVKFSLIDKILFIIGCFFISGVCHCISKSDTTMAIIFGIIVFVTLFFPIKKLITSPNEFKENKIFVIIVSIFFVILSAMMITNNNEYISDGTEENDFFEVRFLSDGTEIEKYSVKNGEVIKEPKTPEKDGYIFSHWATHDHSTDGSEKFDFSTPVTKSLTLFAHYTIRPIGGTINDDSVNESYGYEKIYNEYSEKLKKQCPTLSITECAEISNEGISKMAEYMYRASGTDGQYATYEKWAKELMDVYMKEAR